MQLLYLNDDIKKNYMNDLTSEEAEIDYGIRSYIDIINSIPYVCTTQCCQGHPDNGYLSVMVSKEMFLWFENEVVEAVMSYCDDIIKHFEQIRESEIFIRYVFRFKTGCTVLFFSTFINLLSKTPVRGN